MVFVCQILYNLIFIPNHCTRESPNRTLKFEKHRKKIPIIFPKNLFLGHFQGENRKKPPLWTIFKAKTGNFYEKTYLIQRSELAVVPFKFVTRIAHVFVVVQSVDGNELNSFRNVNVTLSLFNLPVSRRREFWSLCLSK